MLPMDNKKSFQLKKGSIQLEIQLIKIVIIFLCNIQWDFNKKYWEVQLIKDIKGKKW